MITFDVNVLVDAFREDAANHAQAHAEVLARLTGSESVGIDDQVLAAVIRLVSNHRIFRPASTPEEALEFCHGVRRAPAATPLPVGDRSWEIFAGLVRDLGLRANDIPDAWLAARSISVGARLISFDRGFRRFSGLDLWLLRPHVDQP